MAYWCMPQQNPRSLIGTFLIGIFVLALIGVAGYFGWQYFQNQPAPQEPAPQQPPVVDTTRTYASTTLGLSLEYPNDYTADESYTNTSVSPTKPIMGVKFTIPASMATGTNLSADSGISIEWLPRARLCTGDIYLAANVKSAVVTEGVTYSVASSTEAAAGNRYEEVVYAIASSTPCTAFRYFIHSTNIDNYPAGTVREFDRAALIRQFDDIRRSLMIQ